MPGAGRLCPPGCRHSGTRGNVTSPRVICGGDAGPTGRAGGEGDGQRGGGQRPSPAPHAPLTPRPSRANASRFAPRLRNGPPQGRLAPAPPQERPGSGTARLPLRNGSSRAGGRGKSRRPLTFGQRSGLLPATAERHVTPRSEGKASVVAASALAPPFPLLRSSCLQAATFQRVRLLH